MPLRFFNTYSRELEDFTPLAAAAGENVHLRAHGL